MAWMVNELFAEGGKDVAIKVSPGVAGVFQVFVDGEKVFDRKEEGNIFPDLTRVKQIRAILRERLASAVAADDD
jgi:predicted Rdx family selenoprotein